MAGPRRSATRRRDWYRRLLLGAEPVRATSELAASVLLAPLLAAQPRGDGHCVLVIPGWLAGDRSTLPLRRYLSVLGYDVRGWGQGVNRGPTTSNVGALQRRVAELARSSGRSVSVIGWSLGGHYAYQLARSNPANVRQVITLGSPAAMRWTGSRTGSRMADRLASSPMNPPAIPRPWHEHGSLRVPVTAIHSRSDAIVAWRTALVRSAPRRQNVQVYGSHLGLGHNPAVLHVIADRLSSRPDHWKPFRPRPFLRPLFP
jgi:pimeloyl-ACP methyl ester carboxylesterase